MLGASRDQYAQPGGAPDFLGLRVAAESSATAGAFKQEFEHGPIEPVTTDLEYDSLFPNAPSVENLERAGVQA